MYTPKGNRLVYTLLDNGYEDSLISKRLYNYLKLCGVPLHVFLLTADGSRSLVSIYNISFKIGPFDNSNVSFDVSESLLKKKLPSIDKNYPIASNLYSFKNAADLIKGNKFSNLADSNLHIIMG